MSSSSFTLVGDDPLLSPDVLTGNVDPSLPDPLFGSIMDAGAADISASGVGPTLTQLGADPNSPGITGAASAADPSAFNASPTTAAKSGTSIWDNVLALGKIGVGVASVVSSGTGRAAVSPTAAGKTATAKSTNSLGIGGAGTSSTLMIFAVVAFVGIVIFLEVKH